MCCIRYFGIQGKEKKLELTERKLLIFTGNIIKSLFYRQLLFLRVIKEFD